MANSRHNSDAMEWMGGRRELARDGRKTSCRPPLTPIKLGNNSSSLLMEMATINIRGSFHFVVDHSSPQERASLQAIFYNRLHALYRDAFEGHCNMCTQYILSPLLFSIDVFLRGRHYNRCRKWRSSLLRRVRLVISAHGIAASGSPAN